MTKLEMEYVEAIKEINGYDLDYGDEYELLEVYEEIMLDCNNI